MNLQCASLFCFVIKLCVREGSIRACVFYVPRQLIIKYKWVFRRRVRNILRCSWFMYYVLTYSMEQSTSWEANLFSASQEISRILWIPKVHYRIHKYPLYLSLNWASWKCVDLTLRYRVQTCCDIKDNICLKYGGGVRNFCCFFGVSVMVITTLHLFEFCQYHWLLLL